MAIVSHYLMPPNESENKEQNILCCFFLSLRFLGDAGWHGNRGLFPQFPAMYHQVVDGVLGHPFFLLGISMPF